MTKELDIPSSDFVLDLKRLTKLKKLSIRCQPRLQDNEVARIMEWLLQEVKNGAQLPPSNLVTISLQAPVYSVTGVRPTTAEELSEALSNHCHYPMLEDVVLHFLLIASHASVVRTLTNWKARKEIESAMSSLSEKGVLRLRWR